MGYTHKIHNKNCKAQNIQEYNAQRIDYDLKLDAQQTILKPIQISQKSQAKIYTFSDIEVQLNRVLGLKSNLFLSHLKNSEYFVYFFFKMTIIVKC